jgi:PPM family protein phosphatase
MIASRVTTNSVIAVAAFQPGRVSPEGAPAIVESLPSRGTFAALCDAKQGWWADNSKASRLAVAAMAREAEARAEPSDSLLPNVMDAADRMLCDPNVFPGEPRSCSAASLAIADTSLWLSWIGDCRVLRIQGGVVTFQTRDHMLVDDAIAGGVITKEQAKTWPHRNVISRSLGGHLPSEPALFRPDSLGPLPLVPNERVILCTSTLVETVGTAAIAQLCTHSPLETAEAILTQTLRSVETETAIVVLDLR